MIRVYSFCSSYNAHRPRLARLIQLPSHTVRFRQARDSYRTISFTQYLQFTTFFQHRSHIYWPSQPIHSFSDHLHILLHLELNLAAFQAKIQRNRPLALYQTTRVTLSQHTGRNVHHRRPSSDRAHHEDLTLHLFQHRQSPLFSSHADNNDLLPRDVSPPNCRRVPAGYYRGPHNPARSLPRTGLLHHDPELCCHGRSDVTAVWPDRSRCTA